MIDITGGGGSGGFGSAMGAGGPLTPQGIVQLLRLLGGKRDTESLVPGQSFPGYDAAGNDVSGGEDPWKYASFNNPSQTPGINPSAGTPQVGGQQGGGIGGALGKIGSTLKGNAAQILPWAQLAGGIGSNLYGAHLQNQQFNTVHQQTQANQQRLYAEADAEKKRRDAMIQQLLPLLGRDMNSPKIGSMMGSYGAGG